MGIQTAKGFVARGFPSSAIGSDGTIYVGDYDTNLYAINPDGSKKWAFKTGSTTTHGGAVQSSPAIGSDGTIYFGSADNNLYAINELEITIYDQSINKGKSLTLKYFHQHTFTLERFPDGSNMLIQSYQPGYNVQHWCGLDDPFIDNPNLQDLPSTWFQPSDSLVAQLGETIGALYTSAREERGEVWEKLPFNPDDALVDSERMDALAFDANHITFESPDTMGATLRGLTKDIDDLS